MANNVYELSFYKKRKCWYAALGEGTEVQNQMVAGADDMLNVLSKGKKNVTMRFSLNKPRCRSVIHLTIDTHNSFGATYKVVSAVRSLPKVIWICNQTHCLLGEHPNEIFVTSYKAA